MRQKQLQYNLVKFFGTAAGAYGEEKAKTVSLQKKLLMTEEIGFEPHAAGYGWRLVYSLEQHAVNTSWGIYQDFIFWARAEANIGHLYAGVAQW